MAISVAAQLAATPSARADESPRDNDGGDAKAAPEEKKSAGRDRHACDLNDSDEGCGCSSHCCRHRGSCKAPSVSLDVAGVRPAFTHVSTGTRSTSEMGVGFAGAADSYALDGTTHVGTEFMIGGGQAGFEGKLAGVVDLGYRLDVTERQGPFGRIGFDGRIQGNDSLYFSALELPRMTLGWQFATRRTVLEIAGRGGPILTGRFNPGGGVRHTTGAWEFGGSAAAQVEFLRFEATAMRINAHATGDGSPVDVGRGNLCAVAGHFGVCGDFMAMHGAANFGGPNVAMQDALATYAGVTFGVSRW